jgi:hypothetical protein
LFGLPSEQDAHLFFYLSFCMTLPVGGFFIPVNLFEVGLVERAKKSLKVIQFF